MSNVFVVSNSNYSDEPTTAIADNYHKAAEHVALRRYGPGTTAVLISPIENGNSTLNVFQFQCYMDTGSEYPTPIGKPFTLMPMNDPDK